VKNSGCRNVRFGTKSRLLFSIRTLPGEPGTVTEKRSKDRRVDRTHSRLHEALVSLIGEKSYDSIVVKEILSRADVGRSTFYTHFRDKDDLLASGIHDILRSARSPVRSDSTKHHDRVIGFSLPVFQHIDQHRKETTGRKAGGRVDVHERLRLMLAELIADDVRKESAGSGKAGRISPTWSASTWRRPSH
jgi:AcrR family transcriptional regulator